MPIYRKKRIEVEANQFLPGENEDHMLMWMSEYGGEVRFNERNRTLTIDTLEGTMVAYGGHWIIKGVAGEFYPCEPEIFRATYETVHPCTCVGYKEDCGDVVIVDRSGCKAHSR